MNLIDAIRSRHSYDEALQKGVQPRESLQKTHKYILENDKLPEYFRY